MFMLFALVAVPVRSPVTLPVTLPVVLPVILAIILPATFKFPPTFRFLAIPTPPDITSAPFAVVVDWVSALTFNCDLAFTAPANLTSLLNVTGPSN